MCMIILVGNNSDSIKNCMLDETLEMLTEQNYLDQQSNLTALNINFSVNEVLGVSLNTLMEGINDQNGKI